MECNIMDLLLLLPGKNGSIWIDQTSTLCTLYDHKNEAQNKNFKYYMCIMPYFFLSLGSPLLLFLTMYIIFLYSI